MKLSGTRAFEEAFMLARDIGHSIPALAKRHSLVGREKELTSAMEAAVGEYYRWCSAHGAEADGLGTKDAIEALERALDTAYHKLTDPKICNRFNMALSLSPANQATFELQWRPPAQVKNAEEAFAMVAELHRIAKASCKIDGRAGNIPRRDDIRAAAAPLRRYWTKVLGRPEHLYQFDMKYDPSVEFLYDSLRLIDDTVSRRLLLELDK